MSAYSQSQPFPEVTPLVVPEFRGNATIRAQQVIDVLQSHAGPIQKSTQRARKLLENREIRRWTEESLSISVENLPDEVRYLEATAESLGVEFEALFIAQHRALFPVEAARASASEEIEDVSGDDCTVGGARLPNGSAWVVKNRDNVPDGRAIVAQHTDESWGHTVLAHSNYGGPIAASSGINTRGLGIVLTRTIVENPPPGVHRGSLMSALLAQCSTVSEGLDMILGLPHLGGTLILGDKTGAIATVELEPDAVSVEWAQHRDWLAKTNHADARSFSASFAKRSGEYYEDSKLRLARMQGTMTAAVELEPDWKVIEPWIATQMGIHEGEGAVCRHEGSHTLGTAVILCDPPTMLMSDGAPCEGRWHRWTSPLVAG